MTHDELLAKINDQSVWTDNRDNGVTVVTKDWNANKNTKALRAVVELHKPAEVAPSVCAECTQIMSMRQKENAYVSSSILIDYPCPTIQAIEKELK